RDPGLLGAASAAEDRVVVLDSVADHLAAAMGASGCQRVNGALERVESAFSASHPHRKRFVVVVAAHVTCCHSDPPEVELGSRPRLDLFLVMFKQTPYH